MTQLVASTMDLLRTRGREMLSYLTFLELAVENDARIAANNGQRQLALEKSLTHVLKANVSLLLYSAMEACTVSLLDDMHDAIGKNCGGADLLNDQLFLMVARSFKNRKTDVNHNNTQRPLHEHLFKTWLSDWNDRSQREKRQIGFSGGVDSLEIFNQLQRFGVFPSTLDKPPSHLTHKALQSTKDRRNRLAHGEVSFEDLGQTLAISSLRGEARAVFRTLRRITLEVDTFLQQRLYLAAPLLLAIAVPTAAAAV